jgi:hypothetical protein
MTPEEVTDAIELAYESLQQDLPHWRDGSSGYEDVARWAWFNVLTDIRAGSIVEHDGTYDLVYDCDGRLVPKFLGTPGRHHIYDDEEKGAELIAKAANGDDVAHNVLCKIAAAFVEGGCAMPARLREYITEALRSQAREAPQRRRGQDPYANHGRNFCVACAILHVVKLGFRPTRNRATEDESACSIVAQALAKFGIHLSDSAVEKIWGQFARVFSEELSES